MKNNRFVTRLKRKAIASTVASVCLVPQAHSAEIPAPLRVGEAVFNDRAIAPDEASNTAAGGAMVLTVSQAPTEWTRKMEREFRRLALEEARGLLSSNQMARLEELSRWRNQLEQPRTTEEVLSQLKRDRLLEKIAEALREYVQFQEDADKKKLGSR